MSIDALLEGPVQAYATISIRQAMRTAHASNLRQLNGSPTRNVAAIDAVKGLSLIALVTFAGIVRANANTQRRTSAPRR
jgi:hypothetical protein